MGQINDSVIQAVKERCDIVELVRSFIQVKQSGRNFLALCPFHNEKSPSFNISADKQFFHCFGCGASGDAISFLQQYENVDFIDAVKMLANRYGVLLAEDESFSPRARSEKAKLYELHQDVCQWFRDKLQSPAAVDAREYLKNRGVTDADIASFQIGYAPESWDEMIHWAKTKKYPVELLQKAGLVVQKDGARHFYDRFRDRLMFAIWNDDGKVIAFSGRVLQKDAKGGKYVNSPETAIFHKSSILYALSLAKKNIRSQNVAVLCEGQLDVIACHRAGITTAVSSQGTAFTEEHARKLKRYTNKVIIAFDDDEAGRKACFKCIEILLPFGINPLVLSWGRGMDPDSLFQQQGPQALNNCLDKARGFFEVLLEANIDSYGIETVEGKTKIAHNMLQYVIKINDSIARSSYIQTLSERLGIHQESLFRELKKSYRRQKLRTNQQQPEAPIQASAVKVTEVITPSIKAELTLLEIILEFEDVALLLVDTLADGYISKTVIGAALKDALDLCLAGDWYSCKDLIKENYLHKSPEIAQKFMSPEYSSQTERFKIDMAVKDCLKKIKKAPLIQRRGHIIELLKSSPEDSTSLKQEFQDIMKELREL